MDINFDSTKSRRKRRRITGVIVIAVILVTGLAVLGVLTSDGPEYQMRLSTIEENHALKEKIAELEDEVADLKKELKKAQSEPDEASEMPASPRD